MTSRTIGIVAIVDANAVVAGLLTASAAISRLRVLESMLRAAWSAYN